MINNQELLSSMVRTTRMGQTGLRAVLGCSMKPQLKAILRDQLRVYDSLEDQARTLAEERGWKLQKKHSALEHMIEHMTRLKVGKREHSDKIAGMVLQGNTQGMISSIRDMHRYGGKDLQVSALNEKLICHEVENIRQMKPFL